MSEQRVSFYARRYPNLSVDIIRRIVLADPDQERGLNTNWILERFLAGDFDILDLDEIAALVSEFVRLQTRLPLNQRRLSTYPNISALRQRVGSIRSIESVPINARNPPILGEARNTVLYRKYGSRLQPFIGGRYPSYQSLMNAFTQADPEGGTNIEWILQAFLNKEFLLEDLPIVRSNLEKFFSLRNTLDVSSRPLNKYTYTSLKELLLRLDKSDIGAYYPSGDPDIQVLYRGPYGMLAVPKSTEASCKLGSRTHWCTAARVAENMFEEYNQQGPLYVWYDNQIQNPDGGYPSKFQFHFETGQYMDASDKPIEANRLEYFRTQHPVLKQLFSEKLQIPQNALEYAIIIGSRIPDLEPIILTDAHAASKYASNVIKGRWYEAEPIIASNPYVALWYAKDVLGYRWIEAEPTILKDPYLTVDYAEDVIKGRWIEAEPIILTDAHAASKYASDVIKGRWIEAEPIILADSLRIVDYAKNAVKGRWIEAEPIILTKPVVALSYAKDVLGYRWIEAEPIISEESFFWRGYLTFIDSLIQDYRRTTSIRGFELLTDIYKPKTSEELSRNLKQYILLKYPNIAQNVTHLLNYIVSVLNERWVEMEPVIMTDPEAASSYASQILKGRWIEAEPIIASNPFVAVWYANNVIKGRWYEAEPIIARDPEARAEYESIFNVSLS